MDRMGRPRSDILAYTMPGFATSDHTKSNAIALAEAIGASIETIDIRPMATELLTGIHPFAERRARVRRDVRERAGRGAHRLPVPPRESERRLRRGHLRPVELALGWATYGVGDQMSHYAVNAGVPKTLIQHLIRWVIAHSGAALSQDAKDVLQAVLDTEISPELVPAGQDGKVQSTEDTIGPYALHDFALFHVLRYGLRPRRSRSSPSRRGRMQRRAPGRLASPMRIATPTTAPRSCGGCACS
jgi:NAD+ synthase (glutamine-hydrolysing)